MKKSYVCLHRYCHHRPLIFSLVLSPGSQTAHDTACVVKNDTVRTALERKKKTVLLLKMENMRRVQHIQKLCLDI